MNPTLQVFRNIMRKVPAAVVVVTAANGQEARGMTCSSFTSISLSPPIISFAIRTPSAMGNLLNFSQRFAVHILSDQQISQSIAFSSPKTQMDIEKFPHFNHAIGEKTIPVLQNCLSVLICKSEISLVVGDHQVYYGEVEQVIQDDIAKQPDGHYAALKPLLYYQQQYRSIGDEAFIKSFEERSLAFSEWTHRAHLRMAWIYLSAKGDNSIEKIKHGIKTYNEANKHLIKYGYNETITMFFCHLVELALAHSECSAAAGNPEAGTAPDTDFLHFLVKYPMLDRFDTIFQFYSKDRLYGEEATSQAVAPDLLPFPQSIFEVVGRCRGEPRK